MSGGWVRFEASWWEGIRDRLPRPLSREEGAADLRWLADRHPDHEVPSRRQLASEWGWSDGEVRGLLRRPEEWWDPRWGPPPRLASPRPPDPLRTQPDPAGPSANPPDTVEPAQEAAPDPAGPTPHPAGPSAHHTRGDPQAHSPARSPLSPRGPAPLEVLAREASGLEGAAARALHGLLAGANHLAPRAWRLGRGEELLEEPELFRVQLLAVRELVRQCEIERVTPDELDRAVWTGDRWPKPASLVMLALQERKRRESEAWADAQLGLPERLPEDIELRNPAVEPQQHQAPPPSSQLGAMQAALLARRERGLPVSGPLARQVG